MSALQTCPSRDDLAKLTSPELPAETLDGILTHLEQCAKCTEVVRELNERNAYREPKLSPTPSLQPADSVELSRLIDLLQRVGPSSQRSTVTNSQALGDTLFRPSSAVPAGATTGTYPFLAPPQSSDELGRLGDYVVLRLLGSGGMGVVFEAEDPHLRRRVALKVMQPSHAVDPAAKQRFLVEARATAAIEHEHIVVIYQVGESAGVPYLAMQLLRGESLADRLAKSSQLPVREAVRIAKEVAEGLAAAHARGLIHRDIKPANIWLDAKGDRVKVVDFGLARDLSGDVQLTHSGAITGTPAYMSPEQVNSKPLDAKSDLFSLGCVLYRMLAGRQPFEGEGLIQVLTAVCHETPKAISSIRADVPPPVIDLVGRLIQKQAALRPNSAREVADEMQMLLGQFSNESGIHVVPAPRANVGRSGGGRKVGLAVAGAAAFFFACFGIWVSIRDKDGKEVARAYAPEGVSVLVETMPTPPSPKASPPSGSVPALEPRSRLSPAYFESQRALAQWVIDRGGAVGLDGKPERSDSGYRRGKVLPPGNFRVTEINLKPVDNLTEDDVRQLVPALDLETLSVASPLTDDMVRQIGRLTTLTRLSLEKTGLQDAAILPLANLARLQYLYIDKGKLTDAAFEVFEKLTSLRELSVRSAGRFRGLEIHRLEKLPHLDTLHFGDRPFDDTAIIGISRLKNVGSLDVSGTFSDAGFEHLLQLPKLRRLDLGVRGVSDAAYSKLFQSQKFTDGLGLANCELGVGCVDALCTQTKVRWIKLPWGFPTTGIERIYAALPKVSIEVMNRVVPRIPGLTDGTPPLQIASRPALQLDGVDDFVDITSDWRHDGAPVTFEAWIIPDVRLGKSPGHLFALEHGVAAPDRLMLQSYLDGDLQALLPPDTRLTRATNLLIAGRLSHIAAVWDQGQGRVYLNGRRLNSEEYAYNWARPEQITPYTYLGSRRQSGAKSQSIPEFGWHGRFLEVRISSRAVYREDFEPPKTFSAEKDTEGLYRFDEGQGETVRDHSGNNRHGRIVGATWVTTGRNSTAEAAR